MSKNKMPVWMMIEWHKRIRYETFTKEQAQKAIDNGIADQRKLKQRMAMKLAEAMSEGNWWPYNPSQSPLMFDESNKRFNGLTRLTALTLSSVDSLVFPVIRGIPAGAYQYIDSDATVRSSKDALYDLKRVDRDAARVNWLHSVITGDLYYVSAVSTLRQKITRTYGPQVKWASEVFPSGGKIGRAPFVVPFMYIHMIDPEFADRWGRAWASANDLGRALPSALMAMRDIASMENGHKPKKQVVMHGGGRRYTHDKPTLRMLNVLAKIHQNGPASRNVKDDASGFKYWSDLARDGAYARHTETHAA